MYLHVQVRILRVRYFGPHARWRVTVRDVSTFSVFRPHAPKLWSGHHMEHPQGPKVDSMYPNHAYSRFWSVSENAQFLSHIKFFCYKVTNTQYNNVHVYQYCICKNFPSWSKMYALIKWHWNSNRNTDVHTCEINIANTHSSFLDIYSSGRPYDSRH